ncbi:MAG: hypothetical protein KIH01_08990 [Candidatus Freyarchaeota archaeon]|nr:hypothetical protein [Candidatus Jordarchaeia archaeon]
MRTRWLLVVLAMLLLLSATYFSVSSAATPVQAKLSGERPQFEVAEDWMHKFIFTNVTGNKSTEIIINSTATMFTGEVKDFYGNTRNCYLLIYRPVALDPVCIFWILYSLYNVFNVTDLSAEDLLALGDSSMICVYVDENDFSLVQVQWIVEYFPDSGRQMFVVLNLLLNETYPYMWFNFPLSEGKFFGNYTEALNISLAGFFNYYNGTWYNYTYIDAPFSEEITFPGTYMFYPAFKVAGIETVTVTAGSYECWKIEVLNPTNPNEKIGYLWYSPDVKNIVKSNVTMMFQNCQYNLYVELNEHFEHSPPAPPEEPPEEISQLLAPYLVASVYSQQQMGMVSLGLGVAAVAAGVAVAIFAVRRWLV